MSTTKFSKEHEWIRVEADNIAVIGITDHAQELLGEIVYVEAPEVDAEVAKEDAIAVVESVKAASDVYAPISGTVIAVNEELEDAPETVNNSAEEDGWLFKIQLSDESELEELMDKAAYDAFVAEGDDH